MYIYDSTLSCMLSLLQQLIDIHAASNSRGNEHTETVCVSTVLLIDIKMQDLV